MPNIFPKPANIVPLQIIICLLVVAATAVAAVTYYWTPSWSKQGYQPVQPVSFNHQLHVEQVGMDCRYCHTYVDRSGHSNVPATSTCMNCHSQVRKDDAMLAQVRESYESGEPIPWVRIHAAPDYVYFNHSVHVNRGISCVHCHGEVNQMEEVYHAKGHSMSFCLDCHRNPEHYIRPPEHVYDLDWQPPGDSASDRSQWQREKGAEFVHNWNVLPPQSCSGCHR